MTEPRTSAIDRGRLAVAEVLRQDYLSEHETDAPVEDWLPEASKLIDAWLLASNPVGEPETIYDEYHRLREAALWVVLNWDAEETQHMSMKALRRELGRPEQRPDLKTAQASLRAAIGRVPRA